MVKKRLTDKTIIEAALRHGGELSCMARPWVLATANFFSNDVSVLLNQTGVGILIGDVNRDGIINLLDVAPFVALFVSGEFQAEADINRDCVVDLLDVQPFVKLLNGG